LQKGKGHMLGLPTSTYIVNSQMENNSAKDSTSGEPNSKAE